MRGWLTDPNKVFSYYTCFDRQTRPQSHFTHQSSVEPHIYRLVTIQLQGKLAAVCELVSVEKCLNIWTKWTQEDSLLAGLFRTGFSVTCLLKCSCQKNFFSSQEKSTSTSFWYSLSPLHIIERLTFFPHKCYLNHFFQHVFHCNNCFIVVQIQIYQKYYI